MKDDHRKSSATFHPQQTADQQHLLGTNSHFANQDANLAFSSFNQQPQIPRNSGLPQLPGSWFFENGGFDEGLGSGSASTGTGVPGECSPTIDFSDDFQLSSMKAVLNSRTVTDTVEVPSSEHVAEIVGRQGGSY